MLLFEYELYILRKHLHVCMCNACIYFNMHKNLTKIFTKTLRCISIYSIWYCPICCKISLSLSIYGLVFIWHYMSIFLYYIHIKAVYLHCIWGYGTYCVYHKYSPSYTPLIPNNLCYFKMLHAILPSLDVLSFVLSISLFY